MCQAERTCVWTRYSRATNGGGWQEDKAREVSVIECLNKTHAQIHAHKYTHATRICTQTCTHICIHTRLRWYTQTREHAHSKGARHAHIACAHKPIPCTSCMKLVTSSVAVQKFAVVEGGEGRGHLQKMRAR